MKGKRQATESPRRTSATQRPDEQPLLRALVSEAQQRGDSLAALAKHLGVTYERLAQWRRNESNIANAHASVHERAGRYLGLPTAVILALAGVITLEHFVWPQIAGLRERIEAELTRLKANPWLGAFVPSELDSAAPAVKMFVAFLCSELCVDTRSSVDAHRWMTTLHQAAAGNAQAQLELTSMRKSMATDDRLF